MTIQTGTAKKHVRWPPFRETVRQPLHLPRANHLLDASKPKQHPVLNQPGSNGTDEPQFQALPGFKQFAYMPVSPEQVSTAEGRSHVTEQMLEHMRKWPKLSAVISLVPGHNQTTLIVASKENAIQESKPAGVYEIMKLLASSSYFKNAAKKYVTTFTPVKLFDENHKADAIRLPGPMNLHKLTRALAQGGKPNKWGELKSLIRNLPKGKRVAILLGGPSGSGKTTLVNMIKEIAGKRKVAVFDGDMYFRDMDDPDYPKTSKGTPYWDNPDAMHFEEMSNDIARLIKDGKADLPIYDFTHVPPGGWRVPGVTDTGYRLPERRKVELGSDDILVIDSLHATNTRIIDKLTALGLPHASVYLDTPCAEDRLLRRIVRDYKSRSGSAERTVSYWDLTTFPGEKEFIRPTILNLDPAQDLFLITKFRTDLGLSRDRINQKIKLLASYGLEPTYEAFAVSDKNMKKFAVSQAASFNKILQSAETSPDDKKKARAALDRMKSAPKASEVFKSRN